MSNYTTEDCKKFLTEQYPNTLEKKWKRTKKYKDEGGIVCRDFSYDNKHNVTLQETRHGLIEKQNMEYIIEKNLPSHYTGISINEMLFGGGATKVKQSSSYEEKFMHVIENGIDWEAPEQQRSSFDFSKNIDFKKLTKECETKNFNLAQNFLDHVYSCVMFIYELDETYMPHHIATSDFHDSYVDLLEVQKKIEAGYKANNLQINLDKEVINGLLSTIEATKQMASFEDDEGDLDEETCMAIMDDMAKTYKKHLTKSPKP